MSDVEEVNRLLDELARGNISGELVARLAVLGARPELMELVIRRMKELGIDRLAGEPLGDIGDYYVEKPGRFELRWPLSLRATADVFKRLDRRSQFFVLFTEWSTRELEGGQALIGGDTDAAQEVFTECVARAEQIEVPELVARSYEGLMRVAQRLGDSRAAVEWSRRAEAVRAAE